MMEEETAKAESAKNRSLQEMFHAMSNKNNRGTCPDTGINLFEGLDLVDDESKSLTHRAQAAMAAVMSTKR